MDNFSEKITDEEEIRRRDHDDLRAVLALPEGQRLLRRILRTAGPLTLGLGDTAEATGFRQGGRWLGLWLLAEALAADTAAAAALLTDYATEPGAIHV
ncbi:Bbp19 family protein [Novispirillum itersonii]|uniref:Bbp19-like phage domain-containing protein n=1 Tax=Novispirillum itersonii TaxID=189 RepID=A0A7X0DNE9_NOVIT|nr:hypothetical protein [Novispirillum itersonii]MBB6210182.1 hypothetical protein [Novispirillum itersonii]